jgi:hypothetical protein
MVSCALCRDVLFELVTPSVTSSEAFGFRVPPVSRLTAAVFAAINVLALLLKCGQLSRSSAELMC